MACRSISLRTAPSLALAGLLELGELLLHLLQLGGERLLLVAEAALGVAAQLVDQLEGAVADAAAPERDQRVGAGQVLQRGQHEGGVVALGIATCWPRKSRTSTQNWSLSRSVSAMTMTLTLPEATCGLAGRGRLGLLLLGLVVLGLGLGRLLGRPWRAPPWRRPPWPCRRPPSSPARPSWRLRARPRGRRCWPCRTRAPPAQRLALGLVAAQQADRIRHAGELLRRDLHGLRAGDQDRRHLRGGAFGLGEDARRAEVEPLDAARQHVVLVEARAVEASQTTYSVTTGRAPAAELHAARIGDVGGDLLGIVGDAPRLEQLVELAASARRRPSWPSGPRAWSRPPDRRTPAPCRRRARTGRWRRRRPASARRAAPASARRCRRGSPSGPASSVLTSKNSRICSITICGGCCRPPRIIAIGSWRRRAACW